MDSIAHNQHRRSIRLQEYDYSQPGAYFITVATRAHACLFGEVADGEIRLNDAGQLVREIWSSLPARFPDVETGASVVMPNHFHGILEICECVEKSVGAIHELPLPDKIIVHRRMTLPLVVGYFKMNSAKQINLFLNTPGKPVWQRNYYERVIRNNEEYRSIQAYIEANPENWQEDHENQAKYHR